MADDWVIYDDDIDIMAPHPWCVLLYEGYNQNRKYNQRYYTTDFISERFSHMFKVLASNEKHPLNISYTTDAIHRMVEVPLSELPLYVSSSFVSNEFARVLKGIE